MEDKKIHTFAKIYKEDENEQWYHVLIYKTLKPVGELADTYIVPFVFPNLEMAKDFISVLPDKIEEYEIKEYKCNICHLCFTSYKTYKLTIGDIVAYVRWEDTTKKNTEFFGSRNHIKTTNNLVRNFVYNPNASFGYSEILYGEHSSFMLSGTKIYAQNKKNTKKKIEEYHFELIKQ